MQFTNDKKILPIVITSIAIILSIIIYLFIKSYPATIISGKKFMQELQKQNVQEIYIKDNYVYATTPTKTYRVLKYAINLDNLYKNYPISNYQKSSNILISFAVLILLSILVILIMILRRDLPSKIFNYQTQNSSEPDLISDIKPQYNKDISFNNIAGISDVKEELEEIINFLKNPDKFQRYNIRMPKGVLLIGPPGVGKTLIAKAISAEADVPFFYNSGASFVHIYAGAGAKRVKELFKKAKELAPSIIFIDEIDAVGKSRDNLDNNEREATLNQLLIEIDGFNNNSGVVVIGATNRVDVLDNALLRPGRFDRRVYIGLPNIKEREEIIKLYLENKNHTIDYKEAAKLTAGFSPAAIDTLINEAALYALKKDKLVITLDDLLSVKDRVIYGKKRVVVLNKQEREIKSFYQAAKGVVAKWLGFDIDKLSLLLPIKIKDSEEVISKSHLINKAKVLIVGTIYLLKKYNDTFSISKDDKIAYENIIKIILNDYTITKIDANSLKNDIQEDVEKLIVRLEPLIIEVANILNEKEVFSIDELNRKIDEIL